MPQLRQTIAPKPFTTGSLAETDWNILITKMSRPVVTLRFLLSKIVFTDESFSNVEAVTLFVAFERVVELIEKDPTARQKYAQEIFIFRAVFQSLDFLVQLDPAKRLSFFRKNYGFYRGKLFSRRYYFALEGQAKQLYQTFIKRRFPKKFPPKAFVGKGYGDHGTAKDKAFDGSPSWQEVATDERFRDLPESGKNPDYILDFQVHPQQLVEEILRNCSELTPVR